MVPIRDAAMTEINNVTTQFVTNTKHCDLSIKNRIDQFQAVRPEYSCIAATIIIRKYLINPAFAALSYLGLGDKTMETREPVIVVAKQTDDYRIVTSDPDNWHLVANRQITAGEFVMPVGAAYHVDVANSEFVNVILEETGEKRRVYRSISAVAGDSRCIQSVLEIPWCFMNHSCQPNPCDRWNDQAPMDFNLAETEAARAIAKGEELTYDYALEHYEYTPQFSCLCGVEQCRGTIGGFSALSSDEQAKLLSLASPFVRMKYWRDLELGHES
jgi:hypothetical protein